MSHFREVGEFFKVLNREVGNLPGLLGTNWEEFASLLHDLERSIDDNHLEAERLMDQLLDLGLNSDAADSIREILRESREYAEESFVASKTIDRNVPPAPIDPPDSTSPVPEEDPQKVFYFELDGEEAKGAQVKCGSDVDLCFKYDHLAPDAIASVQGEKLEALRKQSGKIDIAIIPHGFSLRKGNASKTAYFKEGDLVKPVKFSLRAGKEPMNGSGVLVLFRVNGCLIYEFFIDLKLIAQGVKPEPIVKREMKSINLDWVLEQQQRREKRDYEIIISSTDGEGHYSVLRLLNGKCVGSISSKFGASGLADFLDSIKDEVKKVSNHAVFSYPTLFNEEPINSAMGSALQGCVETMATVGWKLYSFLKEDKAFEPVLDEIRALQPGSKIAIQTEGCFLPWNTIYPEEFNSGWASEEKKGLNHQAFWGYRYRFESRLIGIFNEADKGQGFGYQQAKSRVKFVSLNINPSLEDDFRKLVEEESLQPHRVFFDKVITQQFGEYHNDPATVKKLLTDKDTQASLIYLYCHGESAGAFKPGQKEELELEKGVRIDRYFISGKTTFLNRPIIFLNSCSSGAYSSLSFLNFYKKFKEVGAEGMIVTDFPIPIMAGAVIGQEIVNGYLKNRTIGEILFGLRTRLLDQMNPIGLFYSLQCPMDIAVEREQVKVA